MADCYHVFVCLEHKWHVVVVESDLLFDTGQIQDVDNRGARCTVEAVYNKEGIAHKTGFVVQF